MNLDQHSVHPLSPSGLTSQPGFAGEAQPRRRATRRYAFLIAALGATGAVIMLAAVVFAPGWPVYAAIVAGVVTGSAAAGWPRR
jgi:hypothetical protein